MVVDPMNSREARIRAREVAIGLLDDLTAWIAAGSVVGLGVFSVIAAATIPGKAYTSQTASASSSTSTSSSTSNGTSSSLFPRHHRDSNGISSSSSPPMVATGASH